MGESRGAEHLSVLAFPFESLVDDAATVVLELDPPYSFA